MVFEFELSGGPARTPLRIGESVVDHRARLAREHAEMEQRRSEALAGQVSVVNAPAERIRIWEKFHGLPLPRSPTHKLVRVIAAETHLRLEEVREVQQQRLAAAVRSSAWPVPES
jgi:hypothetical protein